MPVGEWTSLSCGPSSICVLDEVGRAFCWLFPESQQITSPEAGLVEVAASGIAACGLSASGLGSCWGNPTSGAADIPTTIPLFSLQLRCALTQGTTIPECWDGAWIGPPDAMGPDPWEQLHKPSKYTTCLRDATRIQCWGYDGNIGVGPGLTGSYTDMAGGGEFICGLTGLGEIECAGESDQGGLSPPPGTWSAITGRGSGACALNAAGEHACWGTLDLFTGPSAPLRDICADSGSWACGVIEATNEIVCWGGIIPSHLQQFALP